MSYAPASHGIRTSLYVSSMGKETNAPALSGNLGSAAATTDQASIVRIVLPTPTVIRRFYWSNGATAATNTVQVGIYYDDLTSLLLGTATVASGASQLQFDNVTDTPIDAGRYWIAIVTNGASATLMRHSNAAIRGSAWYQMAAARPLPGTLVPAVSQVAYLFGFTSIA